MGKKRQRTERMERRPKRNPLLPSMRPRECEIFFFLMIEKVFLIFIVADAELSMYTV